MNPVTVEFLMHCHYSPEPHRLFSSNSITKAINLLLKEGAIVKSERQDNIYETTELGQAWVKAICNTPKPKIQYVDSNGEIL